MDRQERPIEFPPRSPDITPMDFFVWGVIKDSVYSRKPRSVEDLRQFVIDAFANLDHDLCTKVCHSVVPRCRKCIEAEDLQFEYLSEKLFALIITVFSDVTHVFSEIFINIKVLFLLLQINIVIQYLTVLLIYYRVSV